MTPPYGASPPGVECVADLWLPTSYSWPSSDETRRAAAYTNRGQTFLAGSLLLRRLLPGLLGLSHHTERRRRERRVRSKKWHKRECHTPDFHTHTHTHVQMQTRHAQQAPTRGGGCPPTASEIEAQPGWVRLIGECRGRVARRPINFKAPQFIWNRFGQAQPGNVFRDPSKPLTYF